MVGTIAELKQKHGFIDSGGKKLFFHERALPGGMKVKELTLGQQVEFDLKDGPTKSQYCDNIQLTVG